MLEILSSPLLLSTQADNSAITTLNSIRANLREPYSVCRVTSHICVRIKLAHAREGLVRSSLFKLSRGESHY